MGLLVLPVDLQNNDFASNVELQQIFESIRDLLNGNLDNANINPSAKLDPRSISNGGAVTQGEVTLTGGANKIPKFDSSGNVVMKRIIFKDQF